MKGIVIKGLDLLTETMGLVFVTTNDQRHDPDDIKAKIQP